MLVKRSVSPWSLVVVTISLWAAGGARSQAMTDLGTLGGRNSQGLGVNSLGQIVGTSEPEMPPPDRAGDYAYAMAHQHAFLWQGGKMMDLGTLAHGFAQAIDINDRGQIAGVSCTDDDDPTLERVHAVLWANGTIRDLGTLPGDSASWALGINDRGEVVGFSGSFSPITGEGDNHAFIWDEKQGMRRLPTPTDADSAAYAINNRGQVTGNSGGVILWDNDADKMISVESSGFTIQQGLNDRGQVTGGYFSAAGLHGFFWDAGRITDLGTLGGGFSAGFGIDVRGQIAGQSALANGEIHAFLWEKGSMLDLGTLGGDFSCGFANRGGVVTGFSSLHAGDDPNLNGHAFIWSPEAR